MGGRYCVWGFGLVSRHFWLSTNQTLKQRNNPQDNPAKKRKRRLLLMTPRQQKRSLRKRQPTRRNDTFCRTHAQTSGERELHQPPGPAQAFPPGPWKYLFVLLYS